MITKTFDINLSINHFTNSLIDTGIDITEDDVNVYILHCFVYDQKTLIDLSTAINSATICFNLANDTYYVATATIEVSGSLSLTVPTSAINFAGDLYAEARLYGATGVRITTNQFKMNVVDDLDS